MNSYFKPKSFFFFYTQPPKKERLIFFLFFFFKKQLQRCAVSRTYQVTETVPSPAEAEHEEPREDQLQVVGEENKKKKNVIIIQHLSSPIKGGEICIFNGAERHYARLTDTEAT